MKTEQYTKLTELATELKLTASKIPSGKRSHNLLLLAVACTFLSTGDKVSAEKMVELVNLKGDREIEGAMLKFLKILLEMP
jgi:hypothetical protein